MEISDYAHYAVLLSPLLKWNIWLRSLRCFSSLTTLITLFNFTTIEWKSLTTLTTVFHFISIKMKYLTTLTTLFFFTDFTHYAVLLSPLLKWNIWLRCFSSLTNLITLFYFITIKWKSLTTLTTVFYFTTIKMKYLTTLTTMFHFTDYAHYVVFPHYC